MFQLLKWKLTVLEAQVRKIWMRSWKFGWDFIKNIEFVVKCLRERCFGKEKGIKVKVLLLLEENIDLTILLEI